MDAIAAQKAGMSYGKYKAAHPGTYLTSVEIEPPKTPKPEPVRRSCARCGKMFEISSTQKRQRYCSIECASATAKERDAPDAVQPGMRKRKLQAFLRQGTVKIQEQPITPDRPDAMSARLVCFIQSAGCDPAFISS